MKIISWNVNGLRSILTKNFDQFLIDSNADIVCLQETKVYEAVTPAIPHYKNTYFNHSELKKGYSGTGTFCNEAPMSVRLIDLDAKHPEGRILLSDHTGFVLVNVYVPNAKADLSRLAYRSKIWDTAFSDFLKDVKKDKPVIVCGDLNVAHQPIDLANPEANHYSPGFTDEERAGFDRYLDIGLVDVFRKFHDNEPNHYSWWSYRSGARARNIGWRIDYFLASEELLPKISSCRILKDVGGSDHAPLELIMDA